MMLRGTARVSKARPERSPAVAEQPTSTGAGPKHTIGGMAPVRISSSAP
jgi:hypothetical protein